MAEIIKPPIESLKELQSYAKKRHEKSDCYTWEKILFRKDFQSWALTHRLHFEFPLHAYAGATTETDIRLLGKTVELAARRIRLWFQLHKGWEIAFQTFLENNIVTLLEDFYEVEDNKTKAISFEQCSELSSTPREDA